MDFVAKIFNKSGISPNMTAIPACVQPVYSNEPKTDLNNAQAEAKLVYGQVISEVLRKTGLKAADVDILITNTSVYCPTPSIASMVINMFKMREDVQAYHMGGMGCAFGVVGLNLVRDMLIAHPGKVCLFASSEIITSAFYPGDRKEALVTNALFRMGGSAAILTNNPTWRRHSKYQLQHCLRVHTGASDRAFNALKWEPDEVGINGLVVTKTLPSEAAAALEKAMRQMAPRIMTWGQYAEAAIHYIQAYAAQVSKGHLCAAPAHKYQPDFTRCADHFLLHAGGYAILRGIQKGLRLPADKMLPSFASLCDFGNTSSSSTWYTWSYIESTEAVVKGQTVLQVGVGGGMKSGVAYWRALRSIKDIHPCWAHLGGVPLTEADLPRPISNEYKSIFDLPSTRSQEEQQKVVEAANAAPRVTMLAGTGNANKAQQRSAAARVVELHAHRETTVGH
ncbi:FAE1/Type III polyketide synthase-like protein-domain-containing protein [Scenedesmus sp. NREL 46B-D3]|nr:FAE1/Type III polyketide synthase-like protein-domain-containing protein [Scenedesmus sp. NREL 46B-D3]